MQQHFIYHSAADLQLHGHNNKADSSQDCQAASTQGACTWGKIWKGNKVQISQGNGTLRMQWFNTEADLSITGILWEDNTKSLHRMGDSLICPKGSSTVFYSQV